MTIANMSPKQLQNLILYHSANSRFHNQQASLIKDEFIPQGFNSVYTPMFDYHSKMANKHHNTAEALQRHLDTRSVL